MKHFIVPIFKVLAWLTIMIIYVICQILHIIWHLTPNKNLLSELIENNYYCYTSRRSNGNFSPFVHNLYKTNITTNSPITYLKWIFKYGFNGEMKDLTKKEKEAFLKFIKNQ